MDRTSILLVEDHAATRRSVRDALSHAGFVVHEAKDGASALAQMERHQPTLVIQDLMLPDIDGFALASKLRTMADGAFVRLIAFSGLVSNLDARRIAEVGFDDVIAKPVPPSRVVDVARALSQHVSLSGLRMLSNPRQPQLQDTLIASNTQDHESDEGELLRRCSELSAQLTVTRALSQSVLEQGDVESALVGALSTCIDAGQGRFGALYLYERDGSLRSRLLGSERGVDVRELDDFFGHEPWLRETIHAGATVMTADAPSLRDALATIGVQRAVVVPLRYRERELGALFMVAPSGAVCFARFVEGVAAQFAEALALAEAFRGREHAEREAEQQRRLARDQAAMWRAMVEFAPDVMMQLDRQGRVRFINRLPPGIDTDHQLSWFELCEREHQGEMEAALNDVFTSGASRTLELKRQTDAGTLWIESHLGPLCHGNQVVGALVIQRDVSVKKQAEAQSMVTDRMTSVGSLAAAIAHEVNNPLASVLANLELALQAVETLGTRAPPQLLDELHDANEAALRVRGIARDLRVFSAPADDPLRAVDLERVLESALRMARNEIRQRASLRREFSPVPHVYGSESRLGQALLALILHVAHGIEEGDSEHNVITVQLADDGSGRVMVAIRHRGPASERHPFTHDAWGLSICQRLLAEHSGSLAVERDSLGESVRVLLPRCDGTARVYEDEPISQVRAIRRGRVLVIDDERLITQVVRRTLERDHEVTTLDSAAEALQLFAAGERYDAILCDLMMPGVSGMDFHGRVEREFPDLVERIVFFTGGAFTPRARDFLQRVRNQRVEKPVAGDELRAVINGVVR